MGIQVDHRIDTATEVQKLLTEYGCFIKTRLGLHNVSSNNEYCSEKGLILLEFIMEVEKEISKLEEKLKMLDGIVVRKMEF